MTSFTAACVQYNAGANIDTSISELSELIRSAHQQGADLICLPEYCTHLESNEAAMVTAAKPEAEHQALAAFQRLAAELNGWLLVGSMAVRHTLEKIVNRSFLIDDQGRVAARYDKIHLFDIDLESGESYRESDIVVAGKTPVIAETPWGQLGMTVCYDLRFPHLYHTLAQAGALYLTIPAAFTKTTGQAHWHVLQRARAIETGSYVIAPSQCGEHPTDRWTYGHSLIVDPWGQVLADAGEEPGVILAQIDPAQVAAARRRIPALQNRRELEPVKFYQAQALADSAAAD